MLLWHYYLCPATLFLWLRLLLFELIGPAHLYLQTLNGVDNLVYLFTRLLVKLGTLLFHLWNLRISAVNLRFNEDPEPSLNHFFFALWYLSLTYKLYLSCHNSNFISILLLWHHNLEIWNINSWLFEIKIKTKIQWKGQHESHAPPNRIQNDMVIYHRR